MELPEHDCHFQHEPCLWEEEEDDDDDDDAEPRHESHVDEAALLRVLDGFRDPDVQLPVQDPQAYPEQAAPSSLQRLASALAHSNSSMRLADAMQAAEVASASWAKVPFSAEW